MSEITDFSMDFYSLKGKNALITGCNSGLGQAFALAFAKAGANIFCPSIVADDGTTQRLIEAEGVRFEFMLVDITQDGACKKVIDTCVEKLGSIDILVNCAGICICKPFKEFTRKDFDKMVTLNLNCAFDLTHEAANYMMDQGSGKVINVCSLFSFLGGLDSPAYASMKAGLMGLTKACADELGKYNIQVNGIAPGYFKTAVTAYTTCDPEKERRIREHVPADRWGERLDLMGPMVFLASKAADYVNGTLLVVDGGYLVR